MSGAVSSAQFIPRAVSKIASGPDTDSPDTGKMFQHWKGESTVAPHAAGAFSTFDRETSFRKQGEGPVANSSTTIGSWLFKNA